MNDNTENDILRGFSSGNDKVIELFYQTHFPRVRSYILRNSGTEADAKDVFQDAIILAYQKIRLETLRLDCSLATYTFAVSRNIWMNTLRKRKKMIPKDQLPEISDALNASILEDIYAREKQYLYQKYFLHLGETCQRLLRYFFRGKNMQEISELMQYTLGYTRKKKFECKEKLMGMIETDPAFRELKDESIHKKDS